jgi:enolase
MNILNGGSHAANNVDIQEFMIIPKKFPTYKEAIRSGVEVFHSLKAILKSKNYNTSIGAEGGFAPDLKNNEEAIELILKAIERAGYKAGQEIMISLDVAASEFYDKNTNQYTMENRSLSAFQLIEYYQELCIKYPIISIEDGLDQNDWVHWKILNLSLGEKVQIVGDDLTVTNPKLLKKAIDAKAMNAILIKLNQIGTFSETIEAINMAKNNDLGVIISHRSGETEDTFISDLSVAVNAGQIKTGSLCRTDRTSKYNQLLRIEELLQSNFRASYNIT